MIDYSFQDAASDHAVETLNAGGTCMYSAPTGSGKTSIQCKNLQRIPELVQLVPQIEIACGFVHRLTGNRSIYDESETVQRRESEQRRIFTYQRFYNLLANGRIELPRFLQYDEAHHSESNRETVTYEYTGKVPRIGYTATPFRGTPKETAKLVGNWGTVQPIIDLKYAVKHGIISAPTWDIWPLIDDELIDVTNGEFSTKSVTSYVSDKMEDLVLRVSALPPRPTMVALSSESLVQQYVRLAHHHGIDATGITAETTNRQEIFKRVLACETILVQIRVVGEGVDLPIRRLIDAAPTMSPVLWQQRLGRITRPTDIPPEYITCCRNLSRHAYLWDGVMPVSAVAKSQAAFPTPTSKRDILRGIGELAGFGRFTPAPVPLLNGITGSLYSLQSPDGKRKIGVLLHPLEGEPIYAERDDSNGTRGTWKRIDELPDVLGWTSTHASPLTEPMQRFYNNMAGYYGIDTTVAITARSFQAFPLLRDLRLKVR